MAKKILTIITALFVTLSLLPSGVRAEEITEEAINENAETEESVQKEAQAEGTEEARSSEGYAYAVLTGDGELVFFRSTSTYESNSEGTFTDIANNTYTGTVFAGLETWYTASPDDLWFGRCEEIKTVRVAEGQEIKPKAIRGWFSGCTNAAEINLRGLNTSMVTSMDYLFNDCSSLERLDISSLDTSNVTDMIYMFDGCISLTSLDLSGLDTSHVTTMFRTFRGCTNLKTINLNNLDTSSLTVMVSTFEDCSSLEELDLSSFETSKVTNMAELFLGCTALKDVNLSGFDTSSVENMWGMFHNCEKLGKIDVSSFDTSAVTTMQEMFAYCTSLKELDLSGFNTSAVTDMQRMFVNCEKLEKLDISGFDTSSVEYMTEMFAYCESLKELDVSGFNTSNTESLKGMFEKCKSLTSLDISGFDTSACTNFNSMFFGCESLTSLDVSGLDTSAATNIGYMFFDCKNLESIDVSHFNTSNVTSMYSLFGGCEKLRSIDVSHFDTSKATSVAGMFEACYALKEVDLTGFNTSQVTDFHSMFSGCKGFKQLDLSSFDTSKAGSMDFMFNGCGQLESIRLGKQFTVWKDNAYLPEGTWTNKAISKSFSEKDLYAQYPANAAAYAGTWERKVILPTSVSISYTELTVKPGEKFALYAHVLPEDASDRSVTWSSSDTNVVDIELTGLFKAGSLGTATVTARTVNGLTATCKVTVTNETKPEPTSITMPTEIADVKVGETIKLSATVLPANADQTVKWSSMNENVATVDPTGTVYGLKAGATTIFAFTVNGLQAKRIISVSFTDVPQEGKYYSDPVYWAVANGITNGYKDDDGLSRTFKPQNNCTREAVVTFLWRLAGKPNPKSMRSPFTDVQDTGKYYYKAVLWAVEKGITKGYADGTFKPNDTCLREHVVTFLYRYAGKPNPGVTKNPFNDVRSSDYYYNAALWANAKGIAKGYSDGPHAGGFGPKLDCLREHVVTFLYRYNNKYPK